MVACYACRLGGLDCERAVRLEGLSRVCVALDGVEFRKLNKIGQEEF
jgi:hypothetical protein